MPWSLADLRPRSSSVEPAHLFLGGLDERRRLRKSSVRGRGSGICLLYCRLERGIEKGGKAEHAVEHPLLEVLRKHVSDPVLLERLDLAEHLAIRCQVVGMEFRRTRLFRGCQEGLNFLLRGLELCVRPETKAEYGFVYRHGNRGRGLKLPAAKVRMGICGECARSRIQCLGHHIGMQVQRQGERYQ
jgi:hypothetical protein